MDAVSILHPHYAFAMHVRACRSHRDEKPAYARRDRINGVYATHNYLQNRCRAHKFTGIFGDAKSDGLDARANVARRVCLFGIKAGSPCGTGTRSAQLRPKGR